MKRVLLFIFLAVLAVTLIACNNEPTPTPEPEPTATPIPEVAPEEPTEAAPAEPVMGTAVVDTVTIKPENNTATVAGNLPDGCTTIDQSSQSVDGSTITIEITTIRPADAMCTTALEPYTEEITIDTSGLEDGEYSVVVNGIAGDQPIVVGEAAVPVTQADLINITWQWADLVEADPASQSAVSNPENYTIAFFEDNTVAIKADCNQASGSYNLDEDSLTIEIGPSTLVFCGETSLDQQYLALLAEVISGSLEDGRLILTTSANTRMGFDNGGTAAASADEAAAGIPADLIRAIGQTWQWTQFTDTVTGEEAIPEPERYQLALNEDGTVNVQADCNQVSGTYTAVGSGITFTFGPSTAAACPEDSLADEYLQYLSAAVIYFFLDDSLYFDLFVDSGTMKFDVADDSASSADETEETAELSGDAIQINVQGLAQTYEWSVQDAGADVPRHILVTFDREDSERVLENQGRRLYIFPVAAYEEVGGDSVIDQVERLEALIDVGVGSAPMPLLPPPSSLMDRWAQYLNLDFADGMGVRYVSDSPSRQSLGVWANDTTAYYYQGLSSDGRFYLSLIWPVSTDALPDTADTAPEDVKAAATNPDANAAYVAAVADELNALAPADFAPDLSDLDALVASITLQE